MLGINFNRYKIYSTYSDLIILYCWLVIFFAYAKYVTVSTLLILLKAFIKLKFVTCWTQLFRFCSGPIFCQKKKMLLGCVL